MIENELKKKLQDKVEKLQKYDSSLFIGQSYFFSDGAQPYLIFHKLYYNLRRIHITVKVRPWESKGLSFGRIVTLDNNLSATN